MWSGSAGTEKEGGGGIGGPFGTSRWCSPSRTEGDQRASRTVVRLREIAEVSCVEEGEIHRERGRTESPPVNRLLIPMPEEELWREVLWRAAERWVVVE